MPRAELRPVCRGPPSEEAWREQGHGDPNASDSDTEPAEYYGHTDLSGYESVEADDSLTRAPYAPQPLHRLYQIPLRDEPTPVAPRDRRPGPFPPSVERDSFYGGDREATRELQRGLEQMEIDEEDRRREQEGVGRRRSRQIAELRRSGHGSPGLQDNRRYPDLASPRYHIPSRHATFGLGEESRRSSYGDSGREVERRRSSPPGAQADDDRNNEPSLRSPRISRASRFWYSEEGDLTHVQRITRYRYPEAPEEGQARASGRPNDYGSQDRDDSYEQASEELQRRDRRRHGDRRRGGGR